MSWYRICDVSKLALDAFQTACIQCPVYGAKVHRRQFWFRFVVVYGTSHSQTSLTFNFFLLKNVFWLLSLSFPCLFLQIFWYHCYLVILYPKAHWVVPLSWLWVCILLFFCQLAFRHFLSSIAVQVFFSNYVYYGLRQTLNIWLNNLAGQSCVH